MLYSGGLKTHNMLMLPYHKKINRYTGQLELSQVEIVQELEDVYLVNIYASSGVYPNGNLGKFDTTTLSVDTRNYITISRELGDGNVSVKKDEIIFLNI